MSTILTLLLMSFSGQASTELATEQMQQMHFKYQPVEHTDWPCTHKQIRDLPDWKVECESIYGKKVFTAHVIVREHPRSGGDTGLEILYWVTAPGDTPTSPRKYASTTALLTLSGNTSLENFSFSQGVENDAAYLVLGWRQVKKKGHSVGSGVAPKEND